MFQIKELEMIHWDFWHAIKVPLDAQIVTIVGPNGSGKTTLLDALRTLLALKCSGKRDYKRYVRNNRENFAWLRGVVSNPKRAAGGLFPYLFFPATAPEVTLFCRIRRQGGDWVRQYAIVEGNVALTPETEDLVQWLGVNEYKRRLEQAGLTPAIAEVLALEQGDTDKLCEYSPKQLLDLVFQVFGDKQVLDNYAEAKLRLKEAEGELGKMSGQLAQLGLDVEALRLRANRYLEWRRLQDEIVAMEAEIIPRLEYAEARAAYLHHRQYLRSHAILLLRKQRAAQAEAQQALDDAGAALQQARQMELDADKAYRDGVENRFSHARSRAQAAEDLLRERERLEVEVRNQGGVDAVNMEKELSESRRAEKGLNTAIAQANVELEDLARTRAALEVGQQQLPDDVVRIRSELDMAGIAHDLLPDIVEVTDPAWQGAVEALLAGYRHIVLLKRASDRSQAWKIGQRLRYRHFIVPDRAAVPKSEPGSLLEVVDFKADPPAWLLRMLNQVQRVDSVEAGNRQDGDWITPDGFFRERRGARDISVPAHRFVFGEAARKGQLEQTMLRQRELNEELNGMRSRLATAQRRITELEASLRGITAVQRLALKQVEYDEAMAQLPVLQQAAAEAGAEVAELGQTLRACQAQVQECVRHEEAARVKLRSAEREALAAQEQVQMALRERSRRLADLCESRRHFPSIWLEAEGLRALRETHETAALARSRVADKRRHIDEGDWETDTTVLQRRDKLIADYAALERDARIHRTEVERSGELTDEARSAYINKLRATVRAYGRNLRHLGELAGIAIEADMPHFDNDDMVLAQSGLSVRFDFDQKGMMGMNDGEASGGQQVMKSLILLIGLMMDESNPSGFVFIDEPFAHLDIFNIDRVGAFLKATQAQYLITTPLTHNTNVYAPSELTLTTRKKRPGETWAPLILQTRRRNDAPALHLTSEPA